jgi:multiple sugar transport system substrate-binding protein
MSETRGARLARPATVALSMVAVAALLVGAACGTATPSATSSSAATPTVDPAVVRWFVGLGSGTQPTALDEWRMQKAFVKDYNESQPAISLQLEIVPNANAYDILKTEIAAGNAPDIVGPVGVRGRNGFSGVFLDLTGEISKHNYNVNRFPQPLVDFFKQGGDGQIGLPYLIYPGFMFYNKDIFEAAGLPDLPTKVGEPYRGKTWDWDNLSEIAAELTFDGNGKKSTDVDFDANKIVQFGIDFQWADGRRMASCISSGSFVGADGKATIPDGWKYAWNWYYDAMWVKHFAPTGKYINSALLNNGTTVSSGHIAMDASWGWAINSYGTLNANGATTAKFAKWDIAVMPSYSGKTSSPMDADMFVILESAPHPDEAFEAMLAIMADPALQEWYGGMPADPAPQQAWFDSFDEALAKVFPGNQVTWSVMQEMTKYPAIPSHEADMPNFLKVIGLYGAFYTKLQSGPAGLNVDAELTKLQSDIQAAFDEAGSDGS